MNERCEFVDDSFEDATQCANEAEVFVAPLIYDHNAVYGAPARPGDRHAACRQHLGMMLTDQDKHLVTRIERKVTGTDA